MDYQKLLFNFILPFMAGVYFTSRYFQYKRNSENVQEALKIAKEVKAGLKKIEDKRSKMSKL